MAELVFDSATRQKRQIALRVVLGKASGLVCIAFIERNKKNPFSEEFFTWPAQEDLIHERIEMEARTKDVYFCPMIFSEKKRTKENVIGTPCAWADLDTCPPDEMLVEPSVIVETSPGRWQAFWVMEYDNDADDMEDLSRRIAYKHADQGADRSGWDLTQLMRVPYTLNFKYEGLGKIPEVKLIDANRNKYRLDDFIAYPISPAYSSVDTPMPDMPWMNGQAEDLLQEKRNIINPMIWSLFSETPQAESSWSEILWRLLMLLFEAGYDRQETYIIAREAKCNKWARDGRPATLLWKEVCRAEGRAELHAKLLVPVPEEFVPLLTEHETELVNKSGDTFIERYMSWASKLGDAAPQYHQAGAFVVLSSLLAGSVQLPTSYGMIVPNIWFMILADTTLTRKTTSMDIATDLILDIDSDAIMATDGSIEGLLNSLATRPGRPSIFLRDEFSGLLEQMTKKDYMAGMPELLTKLYDGKMQKRVLRKETIEVRDPRLIIFAGGIKNKVTGLLGYDMVSSGFMPRFVFITAESDLGRIRPIGPPTTRSVGGRDEIVAELQDLYAFYNKVQEFTVEKLKITSHQKVMFNAELTETAWIRYNKLENDMLGRGLKHHRADVMTPMGDRLAKSILKAALLISASRSKQMNVVVEEIDLLRAIKYGEQWSQHAETVMQQVGKGQEERKLDTILQAIIKNPDGVSRSTLMQSYHLNARDANNIFETLEQRGLITRSRAGKSEKIVPTAYVIRKDMREKDAANKSKR